MKKLNQNVVRVKTLRCKDAGDKQEKPYVPIWHKTMLSLEEAAAYTGIGINKLRSISERHNELVTHNGNKRMFKRVKLDEYLLDSYSI